MDTLARPGKENGLGNNTLARLGGDEFTVILTNIKDETSINLVAQRIIKALSQLVNLGDNQIFVGASIGISIYPDNGEDIETLLKNADAAMYQAKKYGRNNFKFFTEKMNNRVIHRMELEVTMRKAIEQQDFIVHYQPKICVKIGKRRFRCSTS